MKICVAKSQMAHTHKRICLPRLSKALPLHTSYMRLKSQLCVHSFWYLRLNFGNISQSLWKTWRHNCNFQSSIDVSVVVMEYNTRPIFCGKVWRYYFRFHTTLLGKQNAVENIANQCAACVRFTGCPCVWNVYSSCSSNMIFFRTVSWYKNVSSRDEHY